MRASSTRRPLAALLVIALLPLSDLGALVAIGQERWYPTRKHL